MARRDPIVAYQDEPLRAVVHRMAESGLTRSPVLNNDTERKLAGMLTLSNLLKARTRSLEEERHREQAGRSPLFLVPENCAFSRGGALCVHLCVAVLFDVILIRAGLQRAECSGFYLPVQLGLREEVQ